VPEDLSVVGFDDIPAATLVNPQLTTVRQPLTEIGARAMRRLVETIEGRAPEQMVYVLEPELVVRGTTAAPRRETPRTPPSDSRSDKRSQPS
jgi:DNA-binding LacI/PurR family transcriptional regulator